MARSRQWQAGERPGKPQKGGKLEKSVAACYIHAMRYIILAGLIVGALLGYYVLWSHLADQVATQATAWIENQRRQGREVEYTGWRLWGFPYRLSLTITNLNWRDPQSPLAWKLGVEEFTAHLQFWDLHHAIFELPGKQRLGWREGNAEKNVELTAERFRASLVLDAANNPLRFAADIAKPAIGGNVLNGWSAEKLLLHARRADSQPPSADLSLQADSITLPANMDGPLGRQMTSLKLIGTLRGNAYGSSPEAMLASWRDGGGVVDFQTVSLHWGGLMLDGDGTLTLDKQFRPLGALGGQIRNANAGIDALAAAGKMKPDEAAAAKAALTLVTKRDAKGEAYLPVPLTAQEGKLFLGPVPLFSLAPVLTPPTP
ncbi:DUF2125 domain-containing protein [Ferrovibrio sp.]|uniref:DUF2125 domain-containing protein n=1 Tax=Ferrovibrio sp. TaxID=1917215 RepID=UPI0035B151B7